MDGTSWGNAVSGQDLQTSINTAVVGDQVWVACGTYIPTTNTDTYATDLLGNTRIMGGTVDMGFSKKVQLFVMLLIYRTLPLPAHPSVADQSLPFLLMQGMN